MPAAANIVLADAQGTPVNHTFVPIGPDAKNASIFWFEDQSQASPIGYWRISMELKRPPAPKPGENSQNRVLRAVIGLHEPILENVSNSTISGISPAPTLSYTPRCFTEYVLPERSSLQNRKDLRKMSYNLQNDTQVVALVETLQGIW
jgi:hypothetical protein